MRNVIKRCQAPFTRFILAFLLLPLLLTGCVSMGKKALLNQRDSIALVSVVSNADINWKDEDSIDPKTISALLNRSLNRDQDRAMISNADELIGPAEKIFIDSMKGSVINLADKWKVLGSAAYKEAKINKYQLAREEDGKQVKPPEYSYVDYRDKNFPSVLAMETGIPRSMYIEFNFTKVMTTGAGKFGYCRANIDMTVTILDNRGKNIFKKTYTPISKETMRVSNGIYSQSELMTLFEAGILDACYDFLDDLVN